MYIGNNLNVPLEFIFLTYTFEVLNLNNVIMIIFIGGNLHRSFC